MTEAMTDAPTMAPTMAEVARTMAPTMAEVVTEAMTEAMTDAPTMAEVVTEAMTEAMTDAPTMAEVMTEAMTEAAGDDTTDAADDMTEAAGDDMTEAAPVTFTISGEIGMGYPSALSDDQIVIEEGIVATVLTGAFAAAAEVTISADAGAQRRMLEVAYTAAFTVAGVSEENSANIEDPTAVAGVLAMVGATSTFNVTLAVKSIS